MICQDCGIHDTEDPPAEPWLCPRCVGEHWTREQYLVEHEDERRDR